MRRTVLLASTLAVVGVMLAAAAHDVHAWREAVDIGDARLRLAPASARWQAQTWLPRDPVRAALDLDGELLLRRGTKAFRVAYATGRGFDNGVTRTTRRSVAEVTLSDVAAHGSAGDASRAGNLLGVLVVTGGRVVGGVTADDRARAAFESAIRRDPSNLAAKYNLELLLRRTRATSTREGAGTGSGPLGRGRRGAGSGTPGRGY